MQRNDLIPFNLEAALAGEKVITRDGAEVVDMYHFKTVDRRYPVFTLIRGSVYRHSTHGEWNDSKETPMDLFMAPKPSVVYRNIFADNVMGALHHDCAADAIASPWVKADGSPKATVCKVTILNGEVIAIETVHRYNEKEAANG